MSRLLRFSYAHAVHHVTLRCNNKEFLFAAATQGLFLKVLQNARKKFGLALHNYCLMTNHVHLLFRVGRDDTLSKAMHWISTSFSRRFNKAEGRRGHLWEGRFRSTIVEQDSYFLPCMAYIDLNPVRAKMVAGPLEYRWSGHRALRDGNQAELDFHPLYLELGADAMSRYSAYVRVLDEEAKRAPVSLATKYFVGSPDFLRRMASKFGLDAAGISLKREDLGSGLASMGPRVGRVSASKYGPQS